MRLTTIGIPGFQHDGFVVTDRWGEFDYCAASEKARAAFRTYVGHFVMIHPYDLGELAELGLALELGRIVEVAREPPPAAGPADPAPQVDQPTAPMPEQRTRGRAK